MISSHFNQILTK